MATVTMPALEGVGDRTAVLGNRHSAAFKALTSFVSARLAQLREEKERERFEVRLEYRVSGEAIQRLEAIYGCRVVVVDRSPASAPFAEAFHCAAGYFCKQAKAWSGEEVCEFDALVAPVALRCVRGGHNCIAADTSFTAARKADEIARLQRMMESKAKVYTPDAEALYQALTGVRGDPRLCLEPGSCQVAADTLVVDLSITDITASTLLGRMAQHQAARAKVYFYFEVDMLFEDGGTLQSGGRWVVDRSADKIYIFAEGLTHIPRVYSYSSVVSYILTTDVQFGQRSGVLEVFDVRCGMYFVQLTAARRAARFDSESEVRLFRAGAEGLVVVEQEIETPLTREGRKRIRTLTTQSTYDKIHERLFSVDDKSLGAATARSITFDVVGKSGSTGLNVWTSAAGAPMEADQLAIGVLKRVVHERVQARRAADLVRRTDGWWANVFRRVLGDFTDFSTALVDTTYAPFSAVDGAMADYGAKVYPLTSEFVYRGVVTRDRLAGSPSGELGVRSSDASSDGGDVPTARAISEVVSNVKVSRRRDTPLAKERIAMVDKVMRDADGSTMPLPVREVSVVETLDPPECSTEQPVGDAAAAVTADMREWFGPLGQTDFRGRAAQIAASDRSFAVNAAKFVVNRGYDEVARAREMYDSRVECVGEPGRPNLQTEAIGAFSARVANAPSVYQFAEHDEFVRRVFDRFTRVCYKPGWEAIVRGRVEGGAWEVRRQQLEDYAARMDASKVTAVLREDFHAGSVDLTKWRAMVKSQPKPKIALSAGNVHKGSQTIIYQESKTSNTIFSSMLTEVHDIIDECLRDNVLMNVRRDNGSYEAWFNSLGRRRQSAGASRRVYESDISQCDKSHIYRNLLYYFFFLSQHGCPEAWTELWEVVIGRKVASAWLVGLMVEFFEELLSGVFFTLSMNCVVTGSAYIHGMQLEPEHVLSLSIQGDDNLAELLVDSDPVACSDSMRDCFNLESKTFYVPPDMPMYFCSRFLVEYDGYYFYVRDPFRAAAAWSRAVPATVDFHELWVSFADANTHYEKTEVMDRLDVATQRRYRIAKSVRGLLRGLTAATLDEVQFRDGYELLPTTRFG